MWCNFSEMLSKLTGVQRAHFLAHVIQTRFLKCLKLQPYNKIPSLVPPNSLKPPSLQCSHDDIHIIVPITQHVFLVGCDQSARREPEKERGSRSVHKKEKSQN